MPHAALVIPGFGGSQLAASFKIGGRKVIWVSAVQLAVRGPGCLALDDSGTVPAPGKGLPLTPEGLMPGYYQRLATRLQALGYKAFFASYDWRLSLMSTRQALVDQVRGLLDQPGIANLYVVAHSMGGLLARLAYPLLTNVYRTRWVRTVYIGTPHGGSHAAARALFKEGDFFQLATKCAYNRDSVFPFGQAEAGVYNTMITWPGLYELLPFRNGPYGDLDPNVAKLWDANTYYPPVKPPQRRFAEAETTQDALDAALAGPRPSEANVIGTGQETVDRFVQRTSFVGQLPPSGIPPAGPVWGLTMLGDGLVAQERSLFPTGAPYVFRGVAHADLANDATFLDQLGDILVPPAGGGDFGPFDEPIVLKKTIPLLSPTPIQQPIPGMFGTPIMSGPALTRPGALVRRGDP